MKPIEKQSANELIKTIELCLDALSKTPESVLIDSFSHKNWILTNNKLS